MSLKFQIVLIPVAAFPVNGTQNPCFTEEMHAACALEWVSWIQKCLLCIYRTIHKRAVWWLFDSRVAKTPLVT